MKKKKTISRILAVLFAAVMAACFVPQTGALVLADDLHVHDGVTFTAWTSTDSLPNSGNYFLTGDVKLSKEIEYEITFNNYDGTVLEKKKVPYGDVPS